MPAGYTYEADRVREDGSYALRVSRLWRWGRDGERWLSQKTPSLRAIRKARQAKDSPKSLGDRLRTILYPLHSIGATAVAAGGLMVALLVIAVGAAVCMPPDVSDDLAGTTDLLMQIAGVIGGVIGILIAVVVFAVQFHGGPNRDASQLMRFLIRWESLVPIAGFALAFVAAQIIAATIARLWWEPIAHGMAIVDMVGAPLAIWLAIYLFYRMLISISVDFFTHGVLPGLAHEFEQLLDAESMRAAMNMRLIVSGPSRDQYAGELGKLGIGYGPDGISRIDDALPLGVPVTGKITDVNLPMLARLNRQVKAACDNANLYVTPELEVGEVLHDSRIVYVSHPTLPRHCLEARLAGSQHTINRMIYRAFRFAEPDDNDLHSMVGAVVESATERVRVGQWREADQVVRIVETLHKRRLVRPDRKRLGIDDSASIDLFGLFERKKSVYNIAIAAADSRNPDVVNVVSKFARRIAEAAWEYDAKELYEQSLELLAVMYVRTAESVEPEPTVIERLDDRFYDITQIGYYLSRKAGQASRRRQVFKKIGIHVLINIVCDAMRFGRKQDVHDIHYRAIQVVESDRDERGVDGQLDGELVRYLCYGQILLTGWCVKLIRNGHCDAILLRDLVNAFSEQTLELLHNANANHIDNCWMDAWEAYGGSDADMPFGARRWHDRLQRWRNGVTNTRTISTEWVLEGFLVILLWTRDEFPRARGNRQSVESLLSRDRVQSAISRLGSVEGLPEALFGEDASEIPNDARNGVIAALVDRDIQR